nr:nucleotide-binding alpha-beta plait domain-containing protein [Tanacetum cinerariifolium]
MGSQRSKEDEVQKISTSVFVTNFPDQFTAKDLWNTCKQYGYVVDVFIPNRRSKAGKRFGFVRFIKIFDMERLVNNLCTVWVGRHKIHANLARFQRTPLNKSNNQSNNGENRNIIGAAYKHNGLYGSSNSYVNVVKGSQPQNVDSENNPALMLDDSCLNQQDYACCLMSKVNDFASLSNLKVVLVNEGLSISSLDVWVDIGSYEGEPNEDDLENVADLKGDSDSKVVPDNKLDEKPLNNYIEEASVGQKETRSEDPFNIYGVLNKKKENINKELNLDDSLKYPSSFTPRNDNVVSEELSNKRTSECFHSLQEDDAVFGPNNSRSKEKFKDGVAESICSGHFKKSDISRTGGSILQVMKEMAKVGHTMGYNMEGCMKNIEDIINSQGVNDVF